VGIRPQSRSDTRLRFSRPYLSCSQPGPPGALLRCAACSFGNCLPARTPSRSPTRSRPDAESVCSLSTRIAVSVQKWARRIASLVLIGVACTKGVAVVLSSPHNSRSHDSDLPNASMGIPLISSTSTRLRGTTRDNDHDHHPMPSQV
jgi:hypothetical protein